MNGINVTVPTADNKDMDHLKYEFISLSLSTIRTPNEDFEERLSEIREEVGDEIADGWFIEAATLC